MADGNDTTTTSEGQGVPLSARRRARARVRVRASVQPTTWQTAAVTVLIAAVAVLLAGYAAAASYESVSQLAARHHVPLAWLNPLSLDGGLFGFVLLDITLTWTGRSLWWLRLLARLFAAGTVAANAMAGWPDLVGAALRVGAPVMFAVLAEVARAVLARRNRETGQGGPERIPWARWLLAPLSTFILWRRMKLWRIRDYKVAVDMELRRLQLIEKLRVKYAGKDWQREAPGDLVWMLRRGVRMAAALETVAELTKPEPVQPEPVPPGPVKRPARSSKTGPAKRRTARADRSADDLALEAKALVLLQNHPGMTGGALARELGVTDSYGRKLRRRLTAQDRPVARPVEPQQDRAEDR